jgi:hypothetical protein
MSVKMSGDKVQKQKQLVLCNLKKAYIKFKETHTNIAISFPKCSGLLERPKWCFLFGAYGTHITSVYNSSEHETYDVSNRYVFMSGGNDMYVRVSLRMTILCMVCVLHVLMHKH